MERSLFGGVPPSRSVHVLEARLCRRAPKKGHCSFQTEAQASSVPAWQAGESGR